MEPEQSDGARSRMQSSRPLIVAVLATVAGVAGAAWLLSSRDSVATDNAYLKADSSDVPPQVPGLVIAVRVEENQQVAAGDVLVELDPDDYLQRVSSAEADVAASRASLAAAEAALRRLQSQQRLAEASVEEVSSRIRAADAQRERKLADRTRHQELVNQRLTSRELYDAAIADATEAEAESDRARAALKVAQRQVQVVDSQHAELLAQLDAARASVQRAEAALAVARRNAERTRIVAPIAGIVGNRRVQVGEYVQVGSRLMTIVPVHDLYVVANFKETQTARMLVGQRAEIELDALPGQVLHGRVESLAPGSGAEFALLPFEPANGNFTKIVQRVPVRIRLDDEARALALRPGLSAEVSVDLEVKPARPTKVARAK